MFYNKLAVVNHRNSTAVTLKFVRLSAVKKEKYRCHLEEMRTCIITHGRIVDFDATQNQRNSEYERK